MTTQETSTATATSAPAITREASVAPFATIIEQFRVADHDALNARLLEAIAVLRAAGGGVDASNRYGWHSPRDLFKRQEPAFQDLFKLVRSATVQYIRRYWSSFDPADAKLVGECWANVNGAGAFNTPHAHGEYHISGCYYAAIPEQSDRWSGIIEFLNPQCALSPTLALGKKMSPDKFRIKPAEGLMVLFPSYLRHWVYPNLENEERVSLAFNVTVLDGHDDTRATQAAGTLAKL